MMILACSFVCNAQQRYNLTVWLHGSQQVNTNAWSIVFGDNFTTKYDMSIYDSEKNKDVANGVENLQLYLKDNNGNELGPMAIDDFKKVPVGYYKVQVRFKGGIIFDYKPDNPDGTNDGKTLTVSPRPLAFVQKHTEFFHCMFTGSKNFSVNDYNDGSSTDFDAKKQSFINSYELSNLPDFDVAAQSTIVDLDNTVLEFFSSEASESLKSGTIHWKLKANPEQSDNWISNYTWDDGTFDGFIHTECPYTVVWKKDGSTVQDQIDVSYGDDTQLYYGLTPELYDNNSTLVNGTMNMTWSEDGGHIFKNFETGKTMSAGNYVFQAVYNKNSTCKSQIAVNVSKMAIAPKLDDIVTQKDYDGNTSVTSYGDFAIPQPDFLGNDDVYIAVLSAEYVSPDVNDSRSNDIEVEYELQGDAKVAKNYELKPTHQTISGRINPIQPSVEWYYANVKCADLQKQLIENGEPINAVSASLNFGTAAHNHFLKDYTVQYELYYKGQKIDVNTPLEGGETYQWKAIYTSTNPGNLLDASSIIDVTAGKAEIRLVWTGTNRDNLEYPFAKVADGLEYSASNVPDNSKSEIVYTYYLSDKDDLSISKQDLLTDSHKVEEGFAPKPGNYMFGCVATDKKGYMDDGSIAEPIEIKKASGGMTITKPNIKISKSYDGNYFATVESDASFQGYTFPTTAYYVDGDVEYDATQISESDFRKDADINYMIFYKMEIPDEVLEQYNLSVYNPALDENIDCIPDRFYYYASNGSITCTKGLGIDVEIPSEFVYGSELGGEGDGDLKVYTTFDDKVVAVEGEWIFYHTSIPIRPGYHPGYNELNVGNHTFNVDFYSHNDNYCSVDVDINLTVVPKLLTIDGDFVIDDKTYDGTDIINCDGVVKSIKGGVVDESKLNEYFPETQQIRRVPNVRGIMSFDKGSVSVDWDYSMTKYPSPEVLYTDATETVVAAYTDIPVSLSLSGSKADNYKLPATVVTGSSKIRPAIQIVVVSPEPPEDVKTYRLVYGKSMLGVDFKVTDDLVTDGVYARYVVDGYDRTFLMQPPKDNPEDYYNLEVQLVEGDRAADYSDGDYKIIARQKYKLYVDKYKLQISEPDILHSKEYDGNASVKWTTVNNCRILNAVEGDDVALDGEPVMSYDNAEIGKDKKISVHYNLRGNHLNRYILPDDVEYNDGVIWRGKIVVDNVTVVDNCNNLVINVSASNGMPVAYNISFDGDALSAGFSNVTDATDMEQVNGAYQIVLDRSNIKNITNVNAKLSLKDPSGEVSKDYPFMFSVNLSNVYLQSNYKKNNDVVLVDNSSPTIRFEAYQWYKFDEATGSETEIAGETKQFFNDKPYLDGWYGAYVWLQGSDVKQKICPKEFRPEVAVSKSAVEGSVTVYPNPAAKMEPVTIRLNNFDTDSYKSAIIYVYNSTGSVVATLKNVSELNTVSLPSGSYSGNLIVGAKKYSFKFIVRN